MKIIEMFKFMFKYLEGHKKKVYLLFFIVFATSFVTLLFPYFLGLALDYLAKSNFVLATTFFILYSLLDLFMQLCVNYPKNILHNKLELLFMKNASLDLFHKVINFPAIAFEEKGVGEYINRIYSDPDTILEFLGGFVRLISLTFSALIIVILFFNFSFILGFELLLFAIFTLLFSKAFYPKMKTIQKDVKKKTDTFIATSTQYLTGIREIKALGLTNRIIKMNSGNIDDLYNEKTNQRNFEEKYYIILWSSYILFELLIILTGLYLCYLEVVTLAIFMMIYTYIGRIHYVITLYSEFGAKYQKITVSLNRINEITNNSMYEPEQYGNTSLDKIDGVIKFKNVSFKYKNEKTNVLNNINLELKPNKKIAIVGKSGSGKTTLFNLLLRFFDASSGVISIDGVDIKELDKNTLRNSISAIRQDPYLFNKSIKDNFLIIDEKLKLKDIRNLCKMAYIDDYIMSLPNKYNTIIGEGGVNLSGGQKQRIAIARTLIKDTKIILFDEATSALDNNSQKHIKNTIDDLVKDHTIVIIAHRLSTIMDADEIILLDEGKVKAIGTHEELLKNKIYKNLYSPELTEFE